MKESEARIKVIVQACLKAENEIAELRANLETDIAEAVEKARQEERAKALQAHRRRGEAQFCAFGGPAPCAVM
jgi:precorrin-2 methylase